MATLNIFDNPQFYRDKILTQTNLIKSHTSLHRGKSLICVFFTSYCGVGCPFCFFASPSIDKNATIENKFNKDGLEKFIKFANDANVGYLQISGGGEPFLEKDAILQSIERIKADRIILVTSGIWAYNKNKAQKYLQEINNALSKRKTKTRLSIRLSVSNDHSIKLQHRPLVNLLQLFEENYKNNENFTLQLKSFDGDNTLEKQLNEFVSNCNIEYVGANKSDDKNIVKIMPKKYKISFESGYSVSLGKSRVFNSNLRPNLTDKKSIRKTIEVYNKDTQQSQSNFPSVVFNSNGTRGFDWIVEYNGNVCTWQNRVQDNLLNLYEDDYNKIYNRTIADPLTLSFIEKGANYRENIISEVSPNSVTLMKAVGIRDYAGTLLFEDEKTRLYYTLRVMQDYIRENRIDEKALSKLSPEILNALNMDKLALKKLYQKSRYSILNQELKKEHDVEKFRDFLELVKLGHYKLSKRDTQKAIEHYNNLSGLNIQNIADITGDTSKDSERRFTGRVMTMKKLNQPTIITSTDKKIFIYRHGETLWNVEGIVKGQQDDYGIQFTDRGLEQINKIAKSMLENGIEEIYSSDLERAKNTATLANANLKKPLSFHQELRGFNMGIYQGIPFSEFIQKPDVRKAFRYHNTPIPGGESINQLNARLLAFLNKVALESTSKSIAILTHSAAMSNIKSFISGDKYEDIENCELLFSNGVFKVIRTRQKS